MNAHSPDLFAYAEGRKLRDAGMASAEARSLDFAAAAYAAIERVARRQLEIHVDDILAEDVPEPPHPNCWGGPWMRAVRNQIIQRTVVRRSSRDPRKHAHSYPVYLSMLFDPRSRI